MSISIDIKKHFEAFDLDLAFDAGDETLGLLGVSGCGKSLTLRCIAGLVTPDEGRIVVDNEVSFDSAQRVNLKPQKRKTALLFQDYKLFPNLSVADNIAAGLPKGLSKDEAHERIETQLERFSLRGFGSRYPSRLSGGQQQRIALARMLAAEPNILMLDEPFSALDSHLKAELEDDMMELFQSFKGTVLYVSHDIDEAFRFCDRIAVVDEGRIAQIAPAANLVQAPSTLASVKVSGVKNISRARKLGEHQAEALDWGITLQTNNVVPNNVAWLAVRASYLRQALPGEEENVYTFKVRFTSDSRFDRAAILDPGGIRWIASKLTLSTESLPHKGQAIKIHIPPDKIYMVDR